MKIKTILISAFAGVAAIGAAGTTAGYLLKQNNSSSSFSNSFNTTKGFDNYSTFNTNLNSFDSNPVRTEVVGKNFNLTIQRHNASVITTGTEESRQIQYTMTISQDPETKTQGTIFFIEKDKESEVNYEGKQTITFAPGEKIAVGVKFAKEQVSQDEKLTIRDLLVWGANENHFVKTEKLENGNYSIITPTEEEAKNKDGSSWLYKQGQQINVKATFIKESIGTETKWTHGAYFGDLNGYVYQLKKDTSWSEVKDTIYKTFNNDKKENPIDIYVYLNGFTLTVDEKIEDTYVPSGWALHFHNNDNETKQRNGQYGKIVPGRNANQALIDIKGSLHLGRSVQFDMIHTTKGVQFLSEQDAKTWVGVVSNHPNGEQK